MPRLSSEKQNNRSLNSGKKDSGCTIFSGDRTYLGQYSLKTQCLSVNFTLNLLTFLNLIVQSNICDSVLFWRHP